ncbi:MAG: FtsX-like permease family protein [Myxococcota bacterium]|nr:FtsX-like permease family protein [Myxococcota bacterium]
MRIAWRNLLRNRWRSGLTAAGVAVAVAVIIWMAHMMDAFLAEMVYGATRAELGDFQIHSEAYVEERNLFNTFPSQHIDLEALRAKPEIASVTSRVHAWGLLGHEKTSQTARLFGVDPVHEPTVTTTANALISGTWFASLRPPGLTEVILGKMLAEQLGVSVGDELVVMLQAADGSLGNDSLLVRGIVETKNSTLDRHTAFLRIDDLQWLTALEGRIHEVAGISATRQGLENTVVDLAASLDASESRLAVRSWGKLVPDLKNMSELSKRSMWIFYAIIYLVAGLGLFNTQRMTAYERRREFGVLLAIGTLPSLLFRHVLAESAALTAFGGLIGGLLGLAASWWHSLYGLPLGDGGFEYMGVAFSERLYFELDWTQFFVPVVLIVIVGFFCSLWPALSAIRLDIPSAVSGRQ